MSATICRFRSVVRCAGRCVVLAAVAVLGGGAATAAIAQDPPAPRPLLETAGATLLTVGDGTFGENAFVDALVRQVNAKQPAAAPRPHLFPHVYPDNAARLAEALAEKPGLVLVLASAHDLPARGAEATAQWPGRLRGMVEPLRRAGARTVLVTPPPFDENFGRDPAAERLNERVLPAWASAVHQYAAASGLPVFDLLALAPAIEHEAWARDPAFRWRDAQGALTPAARDIVADALSAFLLTGPSERDEYFAAMQELRARDAGYGTDGVLVAGPAPTINADGTRWVWDTRQTPVTLNHAGQFLAPDAWRGPEDASGRAWAGWDTERLYLGFVVRDDVLQRGGGGASAPSARGDGVRVFLDLRPLAARSAATGPGFVHFYVAPGTTDGGAARLWPDRPLRLSEDARARWRTVDGGYEIEVSLRWADMVDDGSGARFEPRHGADLGFTWVLHDDDGDGRAVRLASWAGAGDPDLDAAAVGRLILIDPKKPEDALQRALALPRALRAADAGASAEEIDELLGGGEEESASAGAASPSMASALYGAGSSNANASATTGAAAPRVPAGTVAVVVTNTDWRVGSYIARDEGTLSAVLQLATRDTGTGTPVRIFADEGVAFTRVVSVMRALTALKITDVAVARGDDAP